MRGLCLYLLGFAFCRLSDSGLRTADYGPESKSRPCAYPHDLGTSSGCRGSYFYLRGELECCQIVILLLRCGFIHSFDSPRAPSRFSLACVYAYPFPANANARAPAFFLLVFPPQCACVNLHTRDVGMSPEFHSARSSISAVCFLVCHAPFSRVWTEQMFYLNAHYYYFISTGDRLRGCVF